MSTTTDPQPHIPDRYALLLELLNTPSPTGSEQAIQRVIHQRFKDVAHHTEPDLVGNLTLALNPNAKRKVMLCGHCDQIGFLVKYISPEGFVYVESLGGTDSGVVLGEHLVVQGNRGPVTGVVGRKPLHLQKGPEMQQIPTKDKIWVDIGCTSDAEVREHFAIGDYATFAPRFLRLKNDFLAAPGLDNKSGLYVCLEVFRRCAAEGCDVGLFVVSTVQEEIGSRGASTVTNRIAPEIGIAVDTAPATDDPGYDLPPQHHAPCKLGHGPSVSAGPNTNPLLGKLLRAAAEKAGLPYQLDPSGSSMPNDSRQIQIGDSGVAAATVGIPQRNMHTQVEVVSLQDLDGAIELLVTFITSLKPEHDFRPFHFSV